MKPPLPSRVPLVAAKLIELAKEQLPAGVEVIDGPNAGDDSTLANDVMMIGHGTDTEPGFTSTFGQLPGLGGGYVEEISVVCFISCYSGDEDMKARRERAGELLALVMEALDENVTVDDTWDHARLGDQMVWYPLHNGEGTSCAVGFTIVTKSAI